MIFQHHVDHMPRSGCKTSIARATAAGICRDGSGTARNLGASRSAPTSTMPHGEVLQPLLDTLTTLLPLSLFDVFVSDGSQTKLTKLAWRRSNSYDFTRK